MGEDDPLGIGGGAGGVADVGGIVLLDPLPGLLKEPGVVFQIILAFLQQIL